MYSTTVLRFVRAPRAAVYQALIDPAAVARLRVPAGMTSHVHTFDARDGGTFRISLTYHGVSRRRSIPWAPSSASRSWSAAAWHRHRRRRPRRP